MIRTITWLFKTARNIFFYIIAFILLIIVGMGIRGDNKPYYYCWKSEPTHDTEYCKNKESQKQ